jgi:hypothetical protein
MKRAALTFLAFLCMTALEPGWAVSAQRQEFSPDDLARRTIERRAVEAVI